MISETWWAYECYTCHTLADVRMADSIWHSDHGPEVKCPVCGSAMEFKSSWPADKHGYGSRGDAPGSLAVDVGDLESRAKSIREFLADMDPDDAGSVVLAVAAEKAIAAGIAPGTFGRMAEALILALTPSKKGGSA